MQIASCLPCIILSSGACLAVPNFSILSHKVLDFMKKETQRKIRALIFYENVPEIFIILSRIHRGVIAKVYKFSRKIPVILVRCY